jgi:sortase (surface protein transpeptidase)
MKFHLKPHHLLRFVAVGLIAASLFGLVPLGYFWLQSKEALAQQPATVPSQPLVQPKPAVNVITGRPVALDIPSLHMHLQIIDGVYNAKTGQWTLTLDKVQFAAAYSEQPNNVVGDTFLYGHYRPEVFAYLHLIKPGAQAIITTDTGYQFTYTFQNTEPFDPANTSVLANQGTGAPRLTIQTCSGSFMQHRQMYYFTYDGYTKA